MNPLVSKPHELTLCTRYLRIGLVESVSFAGVAYWLESEQALRLAVMQNEDSHAGILVHFSEPGEERQVRFYHMFVERFMRSVLKVDPFKCEIVRLHLNSGTKWIEIPEFLKAGEPMIDVPFMDERYLLSLERIHGPALVDRSVLSSECREWETNVFQTAPSDLIPDRAIYVSNVPVLFHPGLLDENFPERNRVFRPSWRM